ncbi:MAG: Plug domain-containing protein [Ignavibacteria bacterium]|nr:Plug domain-containing protein [Ignavibacteria bacterium]
MFVCYIVAFLLLFVSFIDVKAHVFMGNIAYTITSNIISTRSDTLEQVKTPIDSSFSKIPTDTVKPTKPLRTHGSLLQIPYSFQKITKQELQYMNFVAFHDIIAQSSAFVYPLHLGSYGQVNGLSVFGAGLRDVTMQFNGRSLNEKIFGAVNIEEYPPEMAEQIEVFTGADAVIFSDNSAGC